MSKLELDARNPLLVREYEISLQVEYPLTILYASDLHLNARNRHVATQLIDAAQRVRPDLVLLGGDLIDTPAGLSVLTDTVKALGSVAAVPGNHDRWSGVERVRGCILRAGGHWLPDSATELAGLQIGAGEGELACAHDPAIFQLAVSRGARLVLAGHLHGGQAVFGESNGRLYPSAWFYRWSGDCFTHAGATLLVSRGLNDSLPVRWNCPRDVLVCHIRPVDAQVACCNLEVRPHDR